MTALNNPTVRNAIYQCMMALAAVAAALGVVSWEEASSVVEKLNELLPALLLFLSNLMASRFLADTRPGKHRAEGE